MVSHRVEQKARELCKAAGLDPDATSNESVIWPVPLWRAYVPLARQLLAEADDWVVKHKPKSTNAEVQSEANDG